jgi:hypothetical protein
MLIITMRIVYFFIDNFAGIFFHLCIIERAQYSERNRSAYNGQKNRSCFFEERCFRRNCAGYGNRIVCPYLHFGAKTGI